MIPVHILPPARTEDILDVLCDAFFDYPVMRYVVGNTPDYARRLRTLIGLFVGVRVARNDLMLGVEDDAGTLTAVALVNLPGDRVVPPAFERQREAVWSELGQGARARYDAYGAASRALNPVEFHHHLGMIGVRRSHHGQRLGRALLDHLHTVADADPGSSGVSLNTELPRNVALYEYFGYRITGHSRVAPDLETWGFFRDRPRRAPER